MTKIYLSPGFWQTLYYRKVFCKRFSRKCVCGADLVGKVASCISNVDSLCGHLLISLLQNLIVSWQKYLDHSGTAQKEFMTKIVHIQALKIDIYVLPFNFKLQLHLFQFMTWAHIFMFLQSYNTNEFPMLCVESCLYSRLPFTSIMTGIQPSINLKHHVK